MSMFNSTLFNKAIFNTSELSSSTSSSTSSGVSHNRKFKKLPKMLMGAQAVLKVSSGFIIPIYLKTEGKILTDTNFKIESKLSHTAIITPSSKIVYEMYKPIKPIAVSTNAAVTIKCEFDSIELKLNRNYKYDTIKSVLSLLDI